MEGKGKSAYLCTRFERETAAMRGLERRSEKVLGGFEKKKSWKDLEVSKIVLTVAPRNEVGNNRGANDERFWKFLKKKSSKRFGGLKNNTYLCTTFRWKTAVKWEGKDKRSEPFEKQELFCRNIRTAFFEVIEQLKFSTLEKEWFQTIPLRFELKI